MKNLKNVAITLCTSIAFAAAVNSAAEAKTENTINSKIHHKKLTRDQMEINIQKKLAQKPPRRSLYTPNLQAALQKFFKTHDVLFLGEVHSVTNYKFRADNPAIFKEAAKHGARYELIEWPAMDTQAFLGYFEGRLSDGELENFFRESLQMAGNLGIADYHPKQTAKALLKMFQDAKKEGITILPADFRVDGAYSLMIDKPGDVYIRTYTSEAYGIPDIQELNDEVAHQTLLSVAVYKAQYNNTLPVTQEHINRFEKIHNARVDALPEDVKGKLRMDAYNRLSEYRDQMKKDDGMDYQDQAETIYLHRLIRRGEAVILYGGAEHFTRPGSMKERIDAYGLGRIGGINMMSEGGVMFYRYMKKYDLESLGEQKYAFDFAVETESGRIVPPIVGPAVLKP